MQLKRNVTAALVACSLKWKFTIQISENKLILKTTFVIHCVILALTLLSWEVCVQENKHYCQMLIMDDSENTTFNCIDNNILQNCNV